MHWCLASSFTRSQRYRPRFLRNETNPGRGAVLFLGVGVFKMTIATTSEKNFPMPECSSLLFATRLLGIEEKSTYLLLLSPWDHETWSIVVDISCSEFW